MTIHLPNIATQLQIEQWAAKYDARAVLPHLIRKIISETVPNIARLDMMIAEHVDFEGYDGEVTSPVETPFVPEGDSIWEFGKSGSPKAKADKDYKKRSEDPLGVDISKTTFVFVTPRQWRDGKKWAKERRLEKKWKDVRVLNSSDIYAALERSPQTHVWFSEEIGLPSNGVRTLEQLWAEYRGGMRGLLTADIVLSGRERERDDLIQRLLDGAPKSIGINARTIDDVLAFSAAAVEVQDEEVRRAIFDRSLVVFDAATLRALGSFDGPLILLPFDDSFSRQADLIRKHHIILHTLSAAAASIKLPDVPIAPTKQALIAAGVERDKAVKLARCLNKNILLYTSELRNSSLGATASPSGRAELATSQIGRRMWLVGSWNFDHAGDRAVIEEMTGSSVDTVRAEVEELAKGPIPTFTRVGSAWRRFDIWCSSLDVLPLLDGEDLEALQLVVRNVLKATDPALELPRADRWKAGIEGKVRPHSEGIRIGLAATLAVMSARGSEFDHPGAIALTSRASVLVRDLLDTANADSSGKQWESLLDVLSLLAEAGPDVFLEALGQAIRSGGALDGKVFGQEVHFFGPTSPPIHILWALERIAWSLDHFGAAVQLMFELAALDPGGDKNQNRPLNSLVSVFRYWLPQTAASLTSRNKVLDRFATQRPEQAWPLLCALLPQPHSVAFASSEPEFQPWKPESDTPPPMAEQIAAITEVVRLGISLANDEPKRFVDLVNKLDDLPPAMRKDVLDSISGAADRGMSDEVAEAIWKKLAALVRRHREYASAQWALDETALSEIDVTAAKLQPKNQADQVEWLFGHHPDLIDVRAGDNFEQYQDELLKRRVDAVKRVYEQAGIEGLLGLARQVEVPGTLGYAVMRVGEVGIELDQLATLLVNETPSLRDFATQALRAAIRTDINQVIALANRHTDVPRIAARVLLTADDLPRAWEAAKAAGAEIDSLYWAEFEIWGRGSQFEFMNETAKLLAEHGRYAAGLDLLVIYSQTDRESVDVQVVIDILNEFVVSGDDEAASLLSQYAFGELLGIIADRGALSVEELGILQWRLLPALDDDDPASTSAIQKLVATSPEFFVQTVSLLYRRKDDQPDDRVVPEGAASNAWRVLQNWRRIPGSNDEAGRVDEAELTSWANQTRELLQEAGRLDVGESELGKVLSYSRRDPDGTWPAAAVRNFLEAHGNDAINQGFYLGVVNQRGVVMRSLDEGGAKERDLAGTYAEYAKRVADVWPKTARVLRQISESYKLDALREDAEAQRHQEGFDY